MLRMSLLLCVASVLSGCASLSYPLPKCDGYARRPLNRAMWQWEGSAGVKAQSDAAPLVPSRATAFADERPTSPPGPFAYLDVAGSYRSCTGRG
ncbi:MULTISPECIES: hypothetical protein [Xanthobacter]|uniref:hypothetical protein n=1 Tax=Xanthobacter TaxID=279 RepID=UPI0024A695B0|nr:hypothetical protein [Xanthobacter autotrophicus]MDI4655178.1 hypothetical protein [Xanthobacter autotrophicus]MDI4667043.1 hypothetical protein [Xanthobacter autotrophicus]